MNIFEKTVLFCALMTAIGLSALQVTLEPPRTHARQNRAVRLTLSSDRKIDRIEFPAISGAQWLKNRVETSQQWINGRSSYARTLFLIPEKTGTLNIPAFTVHSGKEKAQTRLLELTVLAADTKVAEKDSQGTDISEVVWGKVTLTPERKLFFTGEKINVRIDLFVRERFASAIRIEHYPELLGTGSAVWDSYTLPQSRGKSRFRFTQPIPVVEKNLPCLRYTFTGAFRVMKKETLRMTAAVRVGVLQQNRRSSDPFDDFFSFGMDSFFGNSYAPYTVKIAEIPPVETMPLPPVPDGVLNTGLVGKFQLSGKMSSGSLHAGEISEFQLQIKGRGGVEGFLAPDLQVPGFRVYPPEVKKSANTLTAKYAMIPLEPGQKNFELRFGIFNPEQRKYDISTVKVQAAVVPGTAKNTPAPVISKEIQNAAAEPANPQKKERQEDELFYQKPAQGNVVKIPLIDNNLCWILILLIAAPLAALLLEFRFRKKQKINSDPSLQHRAELHVESAKLIRSLKNAPDCEYIRTAVLPKLGEAMGLSAGVTAQEVAEKCENPELKRFFMELDASGFQPGAVSGSHEKVSPQICKELIRMIRRLMLWICLGFLLTLSAVGSDFNAAFNSGNYEAAVKQYKSMLNSGSGVRPDVLFNLGNAEFRLGNLPMARLYLKQASLLKPEDPEIRGNLAVVDAKLMHSAPETNSLHGMISNLRDYLRPDQYLLIIAILWAVFWTLWAFRRKVSPALFWSMTGILFLFVVFSAGAFSAQLADSYGANKVVVTAPEIRLRSLPGVLSGKNEAVIPGGGDAEILPYHSQGFVRIRINGQEGWVPENQITPLLPGGVF